MFWFGFAFPILHSPFAVAHVGVFDFGARDLFFIISSSRKLLIHHFKFFMYLCWFSGGQRKKEVPHLHFMRVTLQCEDGLGAHSAVQVLAPRFFCECVNDT